jgi:hypothetical protein
MLREVLRQAYEPFLIFVIQVAQGILNFTLHATAFL